MFRRSYPTNISKFCKRVSTAVLTLPWRVSQCSTVTLYHWVNNESLTLIRACSALHTSQAAANSSKAPDLSSMLSLGIQNAIQKTSKLSKSVVLALLEYFTPPQSFLYSWITKEELQRVPSHSNRSAHTHSRNDGHVTSRGALAPVVLDWKTSASPCGAVCLQS